MDALTPGEVEALLKLAALAVFLIGGIVVWATREVNG